MGVRRCHHVIRFGIHYRSRWFIAGYRSERLPARPMINYRMRISCRSQSRCGRITCTPCACRYAGHLAKRISRISTGSTYALEIAVGAFTPADFWKWSIEARNFIDYRRRENRWWRDFCFAVWWSVDGHARGIVGLGSLAPAEIASTLEPRWATTLRPICPADLQSEILKATDPAVIAAPHGSCRYQHLRFSIWPQRHRAKSLPLAASRPPALWAEPMPVLI
jgi:hypothetical protein